MDSTGALSKADQQVDQQIQRYAIGEILDFLKWLNTKPRSVLVIVNRLQDVLDDIREENIRIGGKQ